MRLRTAAVGFAAAATIAVPLATVTTADAAAQARPVIDLDVHSYGVALSPNGDQSKDKARIAFTLAKKSEVIVKIHRTDKTRTIVYKEKLGKLTRGDHTWTWNGKNLNGKVFRDGRYYAAFVADQVAEGGKKRVDDTAVYLDTKFDAQWAPKLSGDTVYPHTPGRERDFIGLTLDSEPDDPMAALGEVQSTLKDAQGRVVSAGKPFEYNAWYYASGYEVSMPLAFFGTDAKTKTPLPAGTYRLRYKVWDVAGNPGGSKAVTVHVSDKPLVEVTGSVVVPPTGLSQPSGPAAGTPATTTARAAERDGRWSPTVGENETRPVPCGTVVPSEVYTEPGAMSFRSADTCGGESRGRPSLAAAQGGVDLASILTPEVAPRGLRTSWVSMRGKPTVAGETDTARLYQSSLSWFYFLPDGYASPAAVPEETVTTTQPKDYPFEAPYFAGYTRAVDWFIATVGADSFDVAAVAVHYTYLTPQAS